MGAAKYNPTSIAAKQGLLPPKPKRMSARQRDALIAGIIAEKTGLNRLHRAMGIDGIYR